MWHRYNVGDEEGTMKFRAEFEVDAADVTEVAEALLGRQYESAQAAFNALLQEFMYDDFDGPQLEGSYTLEAVK